MIGRTVVTLLMLLWAECTYAQMAMPRVEVYATIGGIVGVTPMRIDNARRGALHGGFRADAGIQSGALGLALGARPSGRSHGIRVPRCARQWALGSTRSTGATAPSVPAQSRVACCIRSVRRAR
jgi:hypothetical protein